MENYQKEFLEKIQSESFVFKPFDFYFPESNIYLYGSVSKKSTPSQFSINIIQYSFLKEYFLGSVPHDTLLLENDKFLSYKFLLENFNNIEILYFNTVGKSGFLSFFKFKNDNEFLFEIYTSELSDFSSSDGLTFVIDGIVPQKKISNNLQTKFNCYTKYCGKTYANLTNLKSKLQLDNKDYYIEEVEKNSIFLLSSQGFGSFKKTKYEIEKIEKKCLDFYDEEIVEKSDTIINLINTRKKGMFLFHGEKGCGKTFFIKYVISNSNKDFYYVNGETASGFSSGNFLEFIAANSKNSVFVFEDNEHLLASRESKSNSVISDILNASDGILSDILSPIFIFTFNTKIENIDPAFLRPGRLILEQEFNKLPFAKAKKVAKKIKIKLDEEKDYSLAEIFEKQNFSKISVRSKRFSTEKSRIVKGFSKS